MLAFAIKLAFYGLLRLSNLAPRMTAGFTPTKKIAIKDITLGKTGITIQILWTKTNQDRMQPLAIHVPATGGSDCVRTRWKAYKAALGPNSDHFPLLVNRHHATIMQAALKRALEVPHTLVELPPSGCMHAYRRGGAQKYYRKGIPFNVIKRIGTWKSDSLLRYLQDAVPAHFTMAR